MSHRPGNSPENGPGHPQSARSARGSGTSPGLSPLRWSVPLAGVCGAALLFGAFGGLHAPWVVRGSALALSAIGLAVLFKFLQRSARLGREQQRLKAALQAQHDQLEHEVALRTAELTALSLHLQTVREDERSRLARNLHDDLGALLTSAKLDVARLKPQLTGLPPEAQLRLAHLNETLNSVIALKRRVVDDLWPATLSHLGLVTTLGILAREFTERSGIPVQCLLQPVALSPQAELVAYRVAQEAITNLSKHAHAQHVVLTLSQRGQEVEIAVQDDGVGFSASQSPRASHGLLAMRVRVEGENGRLQIDSQPGAGCRVSACLPAAADPEAPAADRPALSA